MKEGELKTKPYNLKKKIASSPMANRNDIMKIQLKVNYDGIVAVSKLLEQVYYLQSPNKDIRMLQSICFEVSNKFTKAYRTALENNNIFNAQKKHLITLKYHEAYAVEMMIVMLINHVSDDLAKTKLNQIKDFLNQKLA